MIHKPLTITKAQYGPDRIKYGSFSNRIVKNPTNKTLLFGNKIERNEGKVTRVTI